MKPLSRGNYKTPKYTVTTVFPIVKQLPAVFIVPFQKTCKTLKNSPFCVIIS